uniref:Uncharacterized protein n=1 Tax=Arundo donax TaxID=35708 RepID=A0A0A9A234_ARUDO
MREGLVVFWLMLGHWVPW